MAAQKMKQRDAVYDAIVNAMTEEGDEIQEGTPVKLSKDARASVIDQLMSGFDKGTIELKPTHYNDKQKRAYVSGLINNWLRKDKRLNGGDQYKPKNPGSRAGQSDEQVKQMRIMREAYALKNDDEKVKILDDAIEERLSTIKASKVKTKEVDLSKIPDSILKQLGMTAQDTAHT